MILLIPAILSLAIPAVDAEPEKAASPTPVERKRPERVVPTPDRLTGTIVTPNPDGTLKRREHTIGERDARAERAASGGGANASRTTADVEPERRFNHAPYVGAVVLALLVLSGWGAARSGSPAAK